MTKCLSFDIEQMPIGGRLDYSVSSGSVLQEIRFGLGVFDRITPLMYTHAAT